MDCVLGVGVLVFSQRLKKVLTAMVIAFDSSAIKSLYDRRLWPTALRFVSGTATAPSSDTIPSLATSPENSGNSPFLA